MKTETIKVLLTVEIKYTSPEARVNAIRCALEHHMDTSGACLEGAYGAKSIKAEVINDE